jgi:hypothetical protein
MVQLADDVRINSFNTLNALLYASWIAKFVIVDDSP